MVGVWFQAAAVRALKTAAQAALGFAGPSVAMFHEINWFLLGMTALAAGVFSMITSIAGLPEVRRGAALWELEDDDDEDDQDGRFQN